MKLPLIFSFFPMLLACSALHAQPSALSNKIASIDSFLNKTYKDTLPGAAVAITQNGSVVFEKGYGSSNIMKKGKITPATNFNIASLTKQFTAMAILQLAEKHAISLDDPLNRFFPDMNVRVARVVTIRHLLTHSSGIVDHYDYTNTKNMQHAHNADVYNAIKNVDTLYFTPGTKFRYSNTGFCLLALIIEKASGTSYNRYIQQYILQPAGMLHSTIWNENATISNAATGYEWDSLQHHFITSGAGEHIFFSTEGDGGLYTSVQEYLLWLKALNEGKIFSKNIVAKARSLEYNINKKENLGYGFGWFVDESNNPKKVYHSGSNGGFRTYSFTIPQTGFSIVVFSNRADIDVEMIVQKINSILNPDSKPFTPVEVLTS